GVLRDQPNVNGQHLATWDLDHPLEVFAPVALDDQGVRARAGFDRQRLTAFDPAALGLAVQRNPGLGSVRHVDPQHTVVHPGQLDLKLPPLPALQVDLRADRLEARRRDQQFMFTYGDQLTVRRRTPFGAALIVLIEPNV